MDKCLGMIRKSMMTDTTRFFWGFDVFLTVKGKVKSVYPYLWMVFACFPDEDGFSLVGEG